MEDAEIYPCYKINPVLVATYSKEGIQEVGHFTTQCSSVAQMLQCNTKNK